MAETKKIAVIAGDGIGPEVVAEAIKVIRKTEEVFGYKFEFEHGLFGGIAIDERGTPLPDDTLQLCKNADAVLLGAVGGPKWDNNPKELRPETGLLGIRKALGARRKQIMMQFLIESSTLCALGGLLGLLLAAGLAALISATTPIPMTITIGYVLLSILSSGGIGMVAGLYPAYKASRLDPIVALTRN